MATQMNGMSGGIFTWSGPGTSPNGIFDPAAATIGSNIVSVQYQEANCIYTGSATIIVNNEPTSDFIIDSPICMNESSTITYVGTASSNAVFNWDFGGGTVISGSGIGPYEVQFSAGNSVISLLVEENGCSSQRNTIPIRVDAPLPLPVISCQSTTTTSVTFTWDPVPGATT